VEAVMSTGHVPWIDISSADQLPHLGYISPRVFFCEIVVDVFHVSHSYCYSINRFNQSIQSIAIIFDRVIDVLEYQSIAPSSDSIRFVSCPVIGYRDYDCDDDILIMMAFS
jgi:hypothetical protein